MKYKAFTTFLVFDLNLKAILMELLKNSKDKRARKLAKKRVRN